MSRVALQILSSSLIALASVGYGAQPTVTVESSGKPVRPVDSVFRVGPAPKGIIFKIGDLPADNNPRAQWVRYTLEGRDAAWQEPEGVMTFVIRFYDKNGNQVEQRIFSCNGTSSGWKGTIQESMFTRRRESLLVPPGADNLRIVISSAGPPSSYGVVIVDDIVVYDVNDSGGPGRRLFELPAGGEGPVGWDRTGTHPDAAKILTLEKSGFKENALAIVDDSPTSHGEWQLSASAAPKVKPGERLVVEWNEMYRIGSANLLTAQYQSLKAGHYRFRVDVLDVYGKPTSQETVLEVVVTEPYWKNPWFVAMVVLISGGGVAWSIRSVVRLKLRRQFEAMQRERMVEHERLRIARDIHDDLGARLTHISLLSGIAEGSAENERERARFAEISSMARELVSAMYHTVWSVNPENDNMESLVSFLCQSTENLCKPADIRCRIQVGQISENSDVRSEVRHNIILAVKEAVHNVIKHSGASVIELSVSFTGSLLNIRVSDDGCGLEMEHLSAGNGLKNLQRRMEAIGGSVSFESLPSQGTRVCFTIPIPSFTS